MAEMPAVRLLALQAWGVRLSVLETFVFVGMTALVISLVVMMSTRWGQSRPLAKCAALSLIAHVLLIMYAYGTNVLFGPSASVVGTQRFGQVRIDDSGDWDEAEQVTSETTPSLEEAPPEIPSEVVPAETAIASAPAQAEPPPLLPPPMRTPRLPMETPAAEVPDPPSQDAPVENIAAATPPPEPTPIAPPPATPMMEPIKPANSGAEVFAATAARPVRPGDGKPVPEAFANRAALNRAALLSQYGGNPDTERCVQNALDWLVKHQSKDGRWEAARFGAGRETRTLGHDRGGAGGKADTGITGLAVLALLGSGDTHFEGPRREAVQHGLEFLLGSQAADGNLAGEAELFAAMYSHSIALLAVSEAYALTGDARLEPGLRKAVEFSLKAQNPDGGWRYRPGDSGDMSQFGWKVMALRSAQIGGVPVPQETWNRMGRFLDKCSSGPGRGLASYRPGDRPSRAMTAEALACRYFLRTSDAPAALTEASGYVREDLPGPRTNFYYWYYGTLAMFQRGGEDWKEWNAALQAALLDRQRNDGDMAGSWDPDPLWGGYGGRVFSTALGALCLESYYRYLPLMLSDEERELRLTTRPGAATRQ